MAIVPKLERGRIEFDLSTAEGRLAILSWVGGRIENTIDIDYEEVKPKQINEKNNHTLDTGSQLQEGRSEADHTI